MSTLLQLHTPEEATDLAAAMLSACHDRRVFLFLLVLALPLMSRRARHGANRLRELVQQAAVEADPLPGTSSDKLLSSQAPKDGA